MKIVIDDSVCAKHKLTVPEVLAVMSVRMSQNFKSMMGNLVKKEVLVKDDENTYVTQRWGDVIDEILCDSSSAIDDEKRLLELAKKMRECYPEGKMPGTAYYYRCNNREVVLKLKKFFVQYGNYPDDKIIEATKRFVASYQGNYRYLPLIKYFISKNKLVMDEDGTQHVSEVSELASYLENKEDTNAHSNSDDWLVTSRN